MQWFQHHSFKIKLGEINRLIETLPRVINRLHLHQDLVARSFDDQSSILIFDVSIQ
jgi:hypothetical protein